MNESPRRHIMDRDLSADPSKAAQIRSGAVDGVMLGSQHFQVSQMAFLLSEFTVIAAELQKVDNDAGTAFLRALADFGDQSRPVSARRRAAEERAEHFTTLCDKARAMEIAAGNGDGGMTS